MRGKVLELAKEGYYVTPSINVVNKHDPESIYQKSEVFGPNVAIYQVDEIAEALRIVNTSSYGLVLSVFSTDREIFDYCLSTFTHGSLVNFNRGTVGASSRLPFGGMGKSGNNQPAGSFGIYSCTYPVASLEDEGPADISKAPQGMNFDESSFKK